MTAKDKPGQTLDQRRAAHAWSAIAMLGVLKETERDDIVRAARKLPVRIVTAGLGHALVFVRAKGKATRLLDALSDWVVPPAPAPERKADAHATGRPARVSTPAPANKPDSTEPALLTRIRTGTADTLRRDTAECLAWLAWFNRFAEAEFPKAARSGEEE